MKPVTGPFGGIELPVRCYGAYSSCVFDTAPAT